MAPRTTHPGAEAFLPAHRTLSALRDAVQHCEGCPLYANATQAVFGEGPPRAEVMLVGEQPGDLGRDFRVTQHRGEALDSDLAELVTATIHPSAVLRGEDRDDLFAGLVSDLRLVAEFRG